MRLANRLGYDIQPYRPEGVTPEQSRRAKLLASTGVNLVLDVGASTGRWASELRHSGYRGRIVSFEPLSKTYRSLEAASADDPDWECRRVALGSEDGSAEINVAGNFDSSSLLAMEERQLESAPQAAYVDREQIPTARLDGIWDEVVRPGDRPYLKLDVQGFEMEVLRGGQSSLPKLAGLQVELSFVPLYKGAPLYREMIDHLELQGFRLAGLEPGHDDLRTGEMLQADGIFIR
jgi:FkbM family methyltransferase